MVDVSDNTKSKKKADPVYDGIIDAVTEQTKAIAELVTIVKQMKETHDKWVKAGKF